MRDEILKAIEETSFSYRKALIETERDLDENEDDLDLEFIRGLIAGLGIASEIVQDREITELTALLITGEGPDGEQL